MGVWSTVPNSVQVADFSFFVTVVTVWSAQAMPPAGSTPMGFFSGIHHHRSVKVEKIQNTLQCWGWNLQFEKNSPKTFSLFVIRQLSHVGSLTHRVMAASMLTSTLLAARSPTTVVTVTTSTLVFQWQQCVWRMAAGVMLCQPQDVYVSIFTLI